MCCQSPKPWQNGKDGQTARVEDDDPLAEALRETHLCLLDVRAFVAELLAVGADLVRH